MIARIERVSSDKIEFKEFNTIQDILDFYKLEYRQLIVDTRFFKLNKDEPDADFRITILDDWPY